MRPSLVCFFFSFFDFFLSSLLLSSFFAPKRRKDEVLAFAEDEELLLGSCWGLESGPPTGWAQIEVRDVASMTRSGLLLWTGVLLPLIEDKAAEAEAEVRG